MSAVPFGSQAARAIDRYLRLRRAHRLADSPALWLGERSKGLSSAGLYTSLRRRADAAGLAGLPPAPPAPLGRPAGWPQVEVKAD